MVEFAIELRHFVVAVGSGGEGDTPVRMQMVDVREGKETVQRGVDRGRNGIGAEGGHGIHADNQIFFRYALVALFESQHLVEIKGGKAGALDAAEIAAAAFDPEHLDRFAGERVGLGDLGAGIAAAEVGDAQVRAKQV